MASTSAQVRGAQSNPDPLAALPSTFDRLQAPAVAVVEQQLWQLAGSIRDKPHWTTKIQDPQILARWRQELAAQEVPPVALQYVLSEQQWLAQQYPHSSLYPAAARGVFAADGCVPPELHASLLEGVAALEADGPPDWHPGSNQQVRDLVHPSLYPLVYGVTHHLSPAAGQPGLTLDTCLAASGAGSPIRELPPTTAGTPTGWHDQRDVSKRFQWLPSEFEVAQDGTVQIHSYINNLHPKKHQALYPVMAGVFQHFVPLFEAVLTAYARPAQPLVDLHYNWYEGQAEPQWSDYPDNPDAYDAAYAAYANTRVPNPPQIPDFQPPADPTEGGLSLRGRRLQVIVKLASIHLTPDKPEYAGGVWHLEGMKNENIVASGVYHLEQHNVGASSLSFRTGVDDTDLNYEQDDRRGVQLMYGLADEGEANQAVGAASTLPGRCLAWPNNLQHRVGGFRLEDPSQPGHRKILVFWLVHPGTPILSTERVPPQQMAWLKEQLYEQPSFWPAALPDAVQKMVEERVEEASACPYSLAKAHEYRAQLMAERKYHVGYQNEEAFERQISLCEH